ncbi:bifunctional DNA primase/helicase [Parashewanella curva]|uniref:Bifunctional DNA primase/helicase n=1 Tax=Parashewanella curva TaxID=2338552 RepID=A0A3L8PTJ9_9GAMM|nr:toprim domain-containing protein [Parashewanella curva]RLV58616.1 bifunctional DNA primase/helicase [Parashewanella curva]
MYSTLRSEILSRLPRDFKFQSQNDCYLQKGICPSCGESELYTHKQNPWILRCGRLNRCAHELHIKEVYPDLFNSWSERFPSEQNLNTGVISNPNAAADAYLQMGRGIKISQIKGWYQQSSYYCGKRQIGTATVKFTLSNGTTWERFIDQPERFGKMKAYFSGSYQGHWWQPPDFDFASFEDSNELWITEGIFDALSLLQIDIPAVSVMSCNNFPEHDLARLKAKLSNQPLPTLVFAFDRGKAGESFILKFVKRARLLGWQVTAALPPEAKVPLDWNDLLQRERLTQERLSEYRHYGQLLIAPDAKSKGILMYQKTGEYEFPFEFKKCMYWFKFNAEKYNKSSESDEEPLAALKDASNIQLLCLCHPQALYFQENPHSDESWYYFQIDFPYGLTVKKTFTGAQISSSGEFKRRLSSVAGGAIFEGSTLQLNRWFRDHLYQIKQVKVIDFIGYSHEHKSYVFGNVAVQDGVLYPINEEDYFVIKRICLKSLNPIPVAPNYDLTQLRPDFFHYLYQAYSAQGIIILAFWLGSYFAEQCRDMFGAYPFLELVGEPGTGKSTLIELMWKLSGRNKHEGVDPLKSSKAGLSRNLAQVANLPVVLIEADWGDSNAGAGSNFNWDQFKTAYNGRAVRSTGNKNHQNDTNEPLFKGALVISQNAPICASKAILERIIHIFTDRTNFTTESRAASDTLKRWPIEELSGFIIKAVLKESEILTLIEKRQPELEKWLREDPIINNDRISLNHGLLCALVEALRFVVDITPTQIAQAHEQLKAMAIERTHTCGTDHPMLQEFWEVYDFLEGENGCVVNHSRDPKFIAINLNQFSEEATVRKQKLPLLNELKVLLKDSKLHKFIGRKPVNSAVNNRLNKLHPNLGKPSTVKCWVFQSTSTK